MDEYRKAMRRAEREARLAALRDGRKTRAATYTDRKKQASKDACRRPHTEDT